MPTILTLPAPPDAPLGELKAWLAITSPAEDAMLSALLLAALETCEAFTGLTLASEWADIPQSLRQGAVRLAAHLYRGRDGGAEGQAPPAAVTALWRPWRSLRLS